mgnify:FL=1
MNVNPQKLMLPSGKELTIVDVLGFCYGLSETDAQVLMALMRSGPKATEDLEQELQLSKASINRSLNKLLELDLVKRIKETGNKAGRPRYLYSARNFEELRDKIIKDVEDCMNNILQLVKSQFVLNKEVAPQAS